MRIKTLSFLMAGLVAALAPAAQSAANGGSQQRLARLDQASLRNESQQRSTRGSHLDLKRQEREIADAIQRLKAGQSVSTAEIDQILDEVSIDRFE